MPVRIAQNVFRENEVLVLPAPPSHQPVPMISVVEFIAACPPDSSAREVREKAVMIAIEGLRQALPDWSIWLFACHRAWQPATRVTTFKKLWRSFEGRGLAVPMGERTEELRLDSDLGVRWFGAVRLGEEDARLATQIMDAESASVLVAFPPETLVDLARVVASGWSDLHTGSLEAWRDVVVTIYELGGVVMRPFGEFDDREVGTDLLVPAGLSDCVKKRIEELAAEV